MLSQNVLINTGNILSLNEVKKKAGQNPKDELIESLKITLRDPQSIDHASTMIKDEDDGRVKNIFISEFSVTVKLFISSPKGELLKEALDQVFNITHTNMIDSLVIAYSKMDDSEDILTSLLCLWSAIEEYVKIGKVGSIGVSDIDPDMFIKFFELSNIKPNIFQINLTTCCVVPPALQVFTKEHYIQILTHSDPCQILPKEALNEVFGPNVNLHWVVRYQVHVKRRGVLSSKGYLVYINKPSTVLI